MDTIAKEILEIFKDIHGMDTSVTDPINDMEIDSFKFIQILVQLEDKYNIEFDDSDLLVDNISTIESLADIVNRHILNDK
jgi:Phosphopantetheine attachment site.